MTSARVSTTCRASRTARNARISEAPRRTGSSGRNESERYSKKASTRAFLPRAFARAAALTSSFETAAPDFIDGRLLISLKTDCTAPPITIW